ncbi:MAG: Tritrans,polycis-undecaprenyl-diphosphate synthase (GGDP specific) [Methanocella sp. PtaU1.Bin125]|nr:MAG: Tritrans,polycis-undecaprenyl-diphosphate synthase (GGDP specific) [Methanocella sp. PtaU1.Bin125]
MLRDILRKLLFSKWYEYVPFIYRWYEYSLSREVLKSPIPQHIAIIMDGNRRFARRIGESVEKGHTYGADSTERVINWCEDIGVKQLTLYSFSTENFKRPEREKKAIFDLVKAKLRESRERPRTHTSRLRITCVGDIAMLPEDVRNEVRQTDDATSGYDNYYLNIAIAYGGRKEIVDGAIKIAEKVQSGELSPAEITESTLDRYLYFNKNPKSDVDLIIRTGGDERTSNFLPWEASGNECAIYICAPFWPEFRKVDFLRAIRAYQLREREHRVKYALSLIKIKRHNGGLTAAALADTLKSTFKISREDAESILNDPLVAKALKGA